MVATQRSIKLAYFAILREQRGLAEETLLTSAATPGELYRLLAAQHKMTLALDRLAVAINGQFGDIETKLQDGDEIVFIPPVAGG